MKKKLALIHTVNWYDKSVIEPFASGWLRENPDVELINIMDDSLLSEALAHQGPTPGVLKRMVLYAMAAEAAGAHVAMVSCTTMGDGTRLARGLLSIPIFNIDEPMAAEAVRLGDRLGIVATVPTSAPATQKILRSEAEKIGRAIEIQTVINERAFQFLLEGNLEMHDELVHRDMDKLAESVDAIVLGQISLAKIEHQTGVPVLQVGKSGFAEARRLLDQVPEFAMA
jgi:Asp/Glu/hydantoin racemase